MADADEDDFPATITDRQIGGDDDEGEDETQDFRLLAALTGGSKNSQGAILKRGTKDFQPNPTQHQANALDDSRQAMQDALSVVRSQSAKNHNVGQFVDDRHLENPWDLKLREHLTGQDWDDRCVVIYRFKSNFGKTMGRADSRSWTWLLPEEALFLLERGTLDIRWPDMPDADDQVPADESLVDVEANERPPEEPIGELPMSLQGAYAAFVGRSGLTMDRWLVYSGLRRLGYIVQRASSWYNSKDSTANGHLADTDINQASNSFTPTSKPPSLIARLLQFIVNPRLSTPCPSHGPLLAPGLYRSYRDVYHALTLIPHHASTTPSASNPPAPGTAVQPQPHGPYSIAYHVWRPSAPFKKTLPPPVDFRICVLDARATSVPSMSEIGTLLDSMPADELPADKKIEMKIKHGRRNVILAVVDIGVVSYLRFSESCIGDYKIYEGKLARGQKGRGRGRGGGGGGGSGRGRGGGRGGRGGKA